MEDTNQELERLEKELLATEDPLADQELFDLLNEEPAPAFDGPEDIQEDREPAYRNYSNNYGQESEEASQPVTSKDDKVVIGLLITASALCLGILGVLVYWMERFIR